jgi:hypothetical protein
VTVVACARCGITALLDPDDGGGDPTLPLVTLPGGWIDTGDGEFVHADCATADELDAWNAGLAWVELERQLLTS